MSSRQGHRCCPQDEAGQIGRQGRRPRSRAHILPNNPLLQVKQALPKPDPAAQAAAPGAKRIPFSEVYATPKVRGGALAHITACFPRAAALLCPCPGSTR